MVYVLVLCSDSFCSNTFKINFKIIFKSLTILPHVHLLFQINSTSEAKLLVVPLAQNLKL